MNSGISATDRWSVPGFGSRTNFVSLVKTATALAAAILLLPSAGRAGGVVTNCTEIALREAMAGGGTVTFACDGTITLASTITNVADTLLIGSGRSVTITGPQAFYVTNSTFGVIGLTIANCCAGRGGAIFNDGGTVNLWNTVLQNNSVGGCPINGQVWMMGGAIHNQGPGGRNALRCRTHARANP